MPPFIPTKRQLSTPPSGTLPGKKLTLFDTADKPSSSKKTLQDNKEFLENLNNSDDDSSLSDVRSEEFAVGLLPSRKRRKISEEQGEDNDDEVDWEDAIEHKTPPSLWDSAEISGNLELTLENNAQTIGSLTNPHGRKKGPSRIEREIRMSTHRMHVQFLLFHNLTRSRWASDKEVQKILVDQLPEQIRIQVDKWRVDSGFCPKTMLATRITSTMMKKKKGTKNSQERNQRDWGTPAERQEKGEPNMSAGDPIVHLLKYLCVYWKKKFTITAPGLRKQGYRTLPALEEELRSFRIDKHNPEAHGERINGIEGFRRVAKKLEGSRDVGAQLFTALLRGLGVETRLVASLQPIGFGFNKNEDSAAKKVKGSGASKKAEDTEAVNSDEDSDEEEDAGFERTRPTRKPKTAWPSKFTTQMRNSKGAKDAPIDLSEDADASSLDFEDDDESLVDVTPGTPRQKSVTHYDRDLPAPNYWTEVISPITFQVYPVDPLVSKIPIITSPEYFARFEPRGAKADKAKQIFAYIIAYSPDGTAKDVTTRYLKRHVWPGRTKGVRVPIEKLPVYNQNGKIKKTENYDWFKSVMSGYERPHLRRGAVDDLEEEKDLKPAKPEKKEAKVKEDTLQFYKTSAEFVLERHLRREEAIKPSAKPVRSFISGKGDTVKEEPVYRRKDVEVCRTSESWHKEGRAVKSGEHAMKMVPIRAVTLTRKREVEEAERDSGEKQKQGLYARNQTDWIIPSPIENGRIPKNAYGNIDCFVPTMVPRGAVHIPLRKTVMICKKLGIDYAEAVTGFEFGNKMAVPVITGVVVAEQHEDLVIDRWEKDERERKIKEEGKREKMALSTWRKWLMGLRIIQRVRDEYGGDADAHLKEEMNPFTNQSKGKKKKKHTETLSAAKQEDSVVTNDGDGIGGGFVAEDDDGMCQGGFLPEGYDEEEEPQQQSELIIEDDRYPTGSSIRGLTSLTTNGNSKYGDGSSKAPFPGEDEVNLENPAPQSKPTSGRKNPKKVEPRKHSASMKISTISKKGKAATSSDNSDGELAASEIAPATQKPPRVALKRQSARKSEIAVKSHYFNRDSDDENTESEDVVEKKTTKKRSRPAASAKKSSKIRKNM